MDIDFNAILGQLKHVDLTSAAIGAVIARSAEAAIIKAIKPLPAMLVRRIKEKVKALAAAGQIDDATLRLIKAVAAACFKWADDELPDKPGPEKMDALLDKISRTPYAGVLVRADREGVKAILQAAYESIDQEAKAEAAALEGEGDDKKTPAAGGGEVPQGPAQAAQPSNGA